MKDTAVKPATLTLSAGPVQSYPAVLQAMARPWGYDFDPSFQAFYERTARDCARAMRWPAPALILQAEPAVAIEAAAASLISRQDTVLNLASGVYGKGFGYWSARYHKDMVEIEVPFNEAIGADAVAQALQGEARYLDRVRRPSRHAVRHAQPGPGDRPRRQGPRRAAHRRRRVVLCGHGHPSGRLPCGHLHHRTGQVPGRRARRDLSRGLRRGVAPHGRQSGFAHGVGAQLSGLARRLEQQRGVSVHALDRRDQRPLRKPSNSIWTRGRSGCGGGTR